MRRAVVAVLAFATFAACWGIGFAGRSAADGTAPFVKGAATAQAASLGLSIHQGNGTVGLTVGSSVAEYRETYSSATAKPLDLALLKILFGESSRCPGSTGPVPLPDASLPAEIQSNSLQPTVGTLAEADAMLPGISGAPSPGLAGHGTAIANSSSGATATTANPDQTVLVVSLVNPTTTASVALDGTVRRATATSTADRLVILGGILTIDHPTWTATTSSGTTTGGAGTFTTTGGTLLGSPRTPEQSVADLTGLADLLQNTLGFIGVGLDLPTVTVTPDSVAVTPLRLRVRDSEFGRTSLAPFMAAPLFGVLPSLDSTIETALDEAAAQSCDNKRLRQIFDIVLQVLKGSGEIEIPVGGVSVTTDDTPPPAFDEGSSIVEESTTSAPDAAPPSTAPVAVVVAHDAESRGPAITEPLLTTTSEAPPSTTGPPAPKVGAPRPASDGVVTFAEPISTSTRRVPGHTGGAALVIGLIIAALALVGLGADRLVSRRRRLGLP